MPDAADLCAFEYEVEVVGDREEPEIAFSNEIATLEHVVVHEALERLPVVGANAEDGDALDLFCLDKCHELKELIHRAEATRVEHIHRGGKAECHFAGEKVVKLERAICVMIVTLAGG